jgi:hypothetical protein
MDKMIEEYISLAIIHGESTLSGDYKRGNKAFFKMEKLVKEIKESDDTIKRQFYSLLQHDNDNVKTWTASYLLGTFESKALQALKEVVKKSQGIISFNAETTIKEWRKGCLGSIENWEK